MLTLAQFADIYGNTGVTENEFAILEPLACDLVDSVTNYAVTGADNLPPFTRSLLEKAVAAEILYLIENGGAAVVMSGGTGEGFTVGKVRVDAEARASAALAEGFISRAVYALLGPTGLLGRRTECFDPYRLPY